MRVVLYKDGNFWYIQNFSNGNLIGKYLSKDKAFSVINRNHWSIV